MSGDRPSPAAVPRGENSTRGKPHLVVPAIYFSNVTELANPVRVSRVNDALHIQYRWPEFGYDPRWWRW